MDVFIAPEMKMPKGTVNENLEWTLSEELHPFWFVKRGTPQDTPNMELMYLSASHINACELAPLTLAGASVKPVMEVAQIMYPCLVTTVDLEPDQELILKWEQVAKLAPAKAEKGKNAYDQLRDVETKAKKSRQNQ